MTDYISEKEISSRLRLNNVPVYVFGSVDSTNNFAKSLSEDVALVVSESQSSGRGRLGRTFFSPVGAGIYMSVKLPIGNLYSNVPFITTLSAVAVHKAVKKLLNIDTSIKWVNDLYLDGKKVCGILCEVCDDSHAVIGIGINYYPSSLPPELNTVATHLTDSASNVSRNTVTAEIFNNITNLAFSLPDTSFMSYYKQHSCVIGKKVKCIQGDVSFTATAIDIDSFGALVVSTGDGTLRLSTGEISVRFTD